MTVAIDDGRPTMRRSSTALAINAHGYPEAFRWMNSCGRPGILVKPFSANEQSIVSFQGSPESLYTDLFNFQSFVCGDARPFGGLMYISRAKVSAWSYAFLISTEAIEKCSSIAIERMRRMIGNCSVIASRPIAYFFSYFLPWGTRSHLNFKESFCPSFWKTKKWWFEMMLASRGTFDCSYYS